MLFFYKSMPLKYISDLFFSAEKFLFDGVLFCFFCQNKKTKADSLRVAGCQPYGCTLQSLVSAAEDAEQIDKQVDEV